jgi:hypothetical protein
MFLAVDVGATFENVGAVSKSRFSIAELEFLWPNNQIAIRSSNARVRYRFERLNVGSDLFSRPSGEVFACRDDDCDRLSLKMHLAIGQQRLIRNNTADLVLANEISRGYDSNNTLADLSGSGVNAIQFPTRYGRIKYTRKQRPLNNRYVVEINGLAANV